MRTFNNEQEQVEFLKELWENYGRVVLLGLALGLALMYGWRYQQSHTSVVSQQASTLYEQILKTYESKDGEILTSQINILKKDYAKTPYAILAGLIQARAYVEAGEFEQAKEQLTWVLTTASQREAKQIARIRLARLHLQLGSYDEGLAILGENDFPAFDAYANEVKGDLYVAKGDKPKAREIYQQVIDAAGDQNVGNLVDMKLANLAE